MAKDDYIDNVINAGDEGSALLAALTAPTLRNSDLVEILEEGMNGLAVLRIPEDYVCVVHSIGGDPEQKDLAEHASSLVDRLYEQAKLLGATPVGFSNVIDANSDDNDMLRIIVNSLVEKANELNIPIMNGEYAILGPRVNSEIQANVSGTMVSIVPKSKGFELGRHFVQDEHGVTSYIVFDPKGKAVSLNSDGTGTKTDPYGRANKHHLGLEDSLAMKLDDLIKLGATAVAVSDVVETRGDIPFAKLEEHADFLSKQLDIPYVLQREEVGDRIRDYKGGIPSYNISGTAVSVIDEERLKNPLVPKEGEYLVAIRGPVANPRSNGITARRDHMVEKFGLEWHTKDNNLCKDYLEFLSSPSIIFYPVFTELINEVLVSGVYHMSGGAFDGKLARPLAKHNLYAKIGYEDDGRLFVPDWRELGFAGEVADEESLRAAYTKFAMGNDGFVATSNPEEVIKLLNEKGFKARVVGKIEEAKDGRTGVDIETYAGKEIYFSGKK